MGDDGEFFTSIESAEICLYCNKLIIPTTYYIEFDDEIMDLLFKYFTDEDLEILIGSMSNYYKCSKYYKCPVSQNTILKVVKFKLISIEKEKIRKSDLKRVNPFTELKKTNLVDQ